jgi:glutamate synthase domain-containing protein 3
MSMVELEELAAEDEEKIIELLNNHIKYTGSTRAKMVVDDFANKKKHFIKVMPTEYKNILLKQKIAKVEEEDVDGD